MGDKLADNAGQSDLVTVAEASLRLGRSERTIRRWMQTGKLPTVDLAGQAYVQLAEMTGIDDQTAAFAGAVDRHLTGTDADVLRDTIRRQDAEIGYLRGELTAVRESLEGVLRMLPLPPVRRLTESKGAASWVPWVLIAVMVAAAGAVWYLVLLR